MRQDGALADYRRLIVAIVLNVPIILLLFLRTTHQVDFSILTWLYLFTVTVGYYTLAMWIIATIVYLALLPVRRLAIGLAATAVYFFVCYLMIDGSAFTLTGMHIDPFWFRWIISDFAAFGISPATMRSAALAMLLVAAVEFVVFRLAWRTTPRSVVGILVFCIVAVSLVLGQVGHAIAHERNDVRITCLTPYLPAFYPITSHKRATKYNGLLPVDEKLHTDATKGAPDTFTYPAGKIQCKPPADMALPNIVVLFLESWRYDMLSDSVTPNAHALSQKSLVCSQHFCSGNSTVAGLFGFFYGLHATYWTAVKANNSIIRNPALIDVLQEYGYEFGIFAKSNFKRHKIKDAVFQGIEVHETFAGTSEVEQDGDMTNQLISFLRGQQGNSNPCFAFAFYKSNHAPYRYPAMDTLFRPAGDLDLMRANGESDPTLYLNDYKNSTRYVDKLIGSVLRELDSLGFMSNTIIIVTTDHGEEFNDDRSNYWGHGTNFTQYQTLVPLIFFAPGIEPRSITMATSHVDVVPTLLEEFLYCTNDIEDYSNGRNLLGEVKEPRPLVVGSYVNHSFIIDDNVYEICPLYTKDYKLNNIAQEASSPSREMLTLLVEEISHFYKSANRVEPTR